jgi:hypothetical protein
MMMLNVGWLARSSTVHGIGRKTPAMRYLAASLALLVVLLAGVPATSPAVAQPFPRGGGMQQGGRVPFAVILNSIRSRFPGQLSDAQDLGAIYRVKWLTPNGQVLSIDVDARTGNILGYSGGGGGFGGPPPRFERQNFGPERNIDVSRGVVRPRGGDEGPRGPGRGRGRGRGQGGDD